MENKKLPDILDIVFTGKNKEYGAYVLRKGYSRTLTLSVWAAIFFFVLALTSPLIIASLKPKEKEVKATRVIATMADLQNVNTAKKTDTPPPAVEAPPIKTTVKFTVPVVKPDNLVADEFVPTVEQLKDVDPGKKTQQGNPNAEDPGLYNVSVDTRSEEKVVVEEKKEEKAQVFTYVEEMPNYPGGQDAMMDFVLSNIQYPEIAKRAGVEGKVFVSFVVDKNGSISNVSVVKGIGGGCDEEAVRVIRRMPRWNPGKQNGSPVNVQVSIPINFKLQ